MVAPQVRLRGTAPAWATRPSGRGKDSTNLHSIFASGSRQMSERFRTQNVTFAEHPQTDWYWSEASQCMAENQEYGTGPCDHSWDGNL